MATYISLLDDAETMMDEFDAIRKCAKSQKSPRKYVNEWFRKTFPRYEDVPELDEENRINPQSQGSLKNKEERKNEDESKRLFL